MAKNLKKTGELNGAYVKVMHWFFSYPNKETGLNELSEALGIAKTTAGRIVLQLAEEGFLKREVLGRIWRISCNQNHRYNFTRKIAYNLALVYESDILPKIHETMPNPRAVILFGSYRKGDDTEESDIDIAVEIIEGRDVKIRELCILHEFGYRKNVPVNLYIFSRKNVELNLFANIANGIVLEGFLEARA